MAGKKILVVDDDPNLLKLVELILRRAQYDVVTASTGELGIERARDEKPDLILMDVMLPGIDGFVATQQIRRLPDSGSVPIVFLSATDATEAKIRGLRGGGNDYITKPVKTGELLARIEAHLRPATVLQGRTVAVFGSKPGVGTTTLTVNLALALQQGQHQRTFVLDWQRPLGDVCLMLGAAEVRSLEYLLTQSQSVDDHTLKNLSLEITPGLWVVPGSTNPGLVQLMTRKALSGILKTALFNADYALIDGGAFFSWEEPPLVSRGDGMNLIVIAPDAVSIRRAVQIAHTAARQDHIVWFVLNHAAGGTISADALAARLAVSLHAQIPNGRSEREDLLNPGPPFYQRDPQSAFSRAIDQLADLILKVSF